MQSPRSFVAIMEGAARAAKRKHEGELSLAWHSAAFGAAAQCGKLKKLDHYLPKRPSRPQTASEMLGVLREFQARGAKMNIQRVN